MKEYLKYVMSLLDDQDFFGRSGVFMDRELVSNLLTKVLESNHEKDGYHHITPDQLTNTLDKAQSIIIEESFNVLLEDGVISIDGINSDGDFVYSSNINPKKSENVGQ